MKLLLGLLLTLIPSSALALMPLPYPEIGSTNHSYIVRFDGENEASVLAHLTYSNPLKEPVKEISFTIPGKKVKVSHVVQQWLEEKEDPNCSAPTRCYPYTEYKYTALTPTATADSDATKVILALDPPIEPSKSATLYVRYKAEGYTTSKSLGLTDFKFTTPRFDHDIDSVSITISTDDALYLSGKGKSSTNYVSPGFDTYSLTSEPLLKGFSEFYDPTPYDNTYINKNKSDIDADESVEVTGSYATSWLRLNYPIMSLAIIGLIIFLVVIIVGERRMAREHKSE